MEDLFPEEFDGWKASEITVHERESPIAGFEGLIGGITGSRMELRPYGSSSDPGDISELDDFGVLIQEEGNVSVGRFSARAAVGQ
jgi:hypothetical protein